MIKKLAVGAGVLALTAGFTVAPASGQSTEEQRRHCMRPAGIATSRLRAAEERGEG